MNETKQYKVKTSLTKFGTYGFMSALLATQIGLAPNLFADTADDLNRAELDTKKSARSAKRDLKKAGRKVTGQDSKYDDVKDEVKDAGRNAKDEVNYQTEKLKD